MKLIEALQVLRREVPPEAKEFSVALACSFTPLHVQTFPTAHLRLLLPDRRIELQTGFYGDMQGNLEKLRQSDCEACAVAFEWPDFDPRLGLRGLGGWGPAKFPEILDESRNRAARLEQAVQSLAERMPVIICLPSLALPPVSYSPSWQASSLDLELWEVVSALGCRLAKLPQVRIANPRHLEQLSPVKDRLSVESDLANGFPYSVSHAAALGETLARLIVSSSPKKGLITDLDDTLWLGILGEVGIEGVSWDLEHHSQMHGLYQQLLYALSQEGVLVAAASKNDAALVEMAFKTRDLAMPREALFPVEAHWSPKSESIARILKVWNISAADAVFIDDSPAELAEVKRAHPEIECIPFPAGDAAGIYSLLLRLRDLFGKSVLREEDALRMESIRNSHAARDDAGASSASPEQFLEQAEAELKLDFNKSPIDPRALELVNKTNQFNLNGKRHTEVSWRNYLDDPTSFLMLSSYKDKYGPLGKIAVMAGRLKNRTIYIDTWVMSCRAFSRRIEYRCLEEMFLKYDVDEVAFDFVATPRNGPIQTFLNELGTLNAGAGSILTRQNFFDKRPTSYHRVEEQVHG
jgi:FkbH-like protein